MSNQKITEQRVITMLRNVADMWPERFLLRTIGEKLLICDKYTGDVITSIDIPCYAISLLKLNDDPDVEIIMI